MKIFRLFSFNNHTQYSANKDSLKNNDSITPYIIYC